MYDSQLRMQALSTKKDDHFGGHFEAIFLAPKVDVLNNTSEKFPVKFKAKKKNPKHGKVKPTHSHPSSSYMDVFFMGHGVLLGH